MQFVEKYEYNFLCCLRINKCDFIAHNVCKMLRYRQKKECVKLYIRNFDLVTNAGKFL